MKITKLTLLAGISEATSMFYALMFIINNLVWQNFGYWLFFLFMSAISLIISKKIHHLWVIEKNAK